MNSKNYFCALNRLNSYQFLKVHMTNVIVTLMIESRSFSKDFPAYYFFVYFKQ